MNGKQLYGVGARLLGVWLIVNGIAPLPGLFLAFSHRNEAFFNAATGDPDRVPALFLGLAGAAIFVVSGLVLLIRHPLSARSPRLTVIDSSALLAAGVRVLGLVTSLYAGIGLIAGVVLLAAYVPKGFLGYANCLQQAMTCACGLAMLFRTSATVDLILRLDRAPTSVGVAEIDRDPDADHAASGETP